MARRSDSPVVRSFEDSDHFLVGQFVAQRLITAGFETWFVGGCVRDRLLGRVVHDVDICTAARPEQVEVLFDKTIAVGKAFGVMIVVLPSGEQVEVATFRSDEASIDGRHPTGVRFATVEDDVQRRDFTINALLMDPRSGKICDLVGGLEDLAGRRLRLIGDPAARLREDHLRILRGVRFASHLEFTFDPATAVAMRAQNPSGLSRERIWQELDKGLASPRRAQWAQLMREMGLEQQLCPLLDLSPRIIHGLERVRNDDDPLLAVALLLAECPASELWSWWEQQPTLATRRIRIRWLRESAETLQQGCRVAQRRRLLRHADSQLLVRYLQCLEAVPQLSAQAAQWLADEQAAGPLEPLVRAAGLLAAGMRPGPALGVALRAVEDAQLEGRITTREQALALALTLA